jgi:cell fate regulator YaaT (PSP1 superfamily)
MTRLVTIKFRTAGKQYHFNAGELELSPGQAVIVETERGRALGTVVTPPREVTENETPENLKKILRVATTEDIAQAENSAAREKEAFRFCLERIKSRQMDMKLVRAEYLFDGSKIIFLPASKCVRSGSVTKRSLSAALASADAPFVAARFSRTSCRFR